MIYVSFRGICDFHGQNRRGSCVGASRLRPFWKRSAIAFDFSLVADFFFSKQGPIYVCHLLNQTGRTAQTTVPVLHRVGPEVF